MKKRKITGYCDKKNVKNNNLKISKETGLYAVTLEVKVIVYGDPSEFSDEIKQIAHSIQEVDDPGSAFIFKGSKKITKVEQINNDRGFEYLNELDPVYISSTGEKKLEQQNSIEEKNNPDDAFYIDVYDANLSDLINFEKIC